MAYTVNYTDVANKGSISVEDNTINQQTCLLYTSPSPRDQRGSRMPACG